jgi:hypothetical protein
MKTYSPDLFKVRSSDQVLAISYSESTNSLTLIETVAKGKTDLQVSVFDFTQGEFAIKAAKLSKEIMDKIDLPNDVLKNRSSFFNRFKQGAPIFKILNSPESPMTGLSVTPIYRDGIPSSIVVSSPQIGIWMSNPVKGQFRCLAKAETFVASGFSVNRS